VKKPFPRFADFGDGGLFFCWLLSGFMLPAVRRMRRSLSFVRGIFSLAVVTSRVQGAGWSKLHLTRARLGVL
jgi:hypothetical protein